ncbi:MAG: HD domain-containing protein [Bacteroidetes bacterium]|nr:HD domain-containing protein [Bacteroidota bacterium]
MELLKVEEYIIQRIKKELNPCYVYHNLMHTLDVVKSSEIIAKLEGVSEHDLAILKTAAYFHDIGIIIQFKEHEKFSVNIAKEILPQYGYEAGDIEVINGLILATQMPQHADNKLQEIICDADLDYLGRDDYFKISSFLRKEWLCLFKMDLLDLEWYKSQKAFLSNHTYLTASSRKIRNEMKMQNILKVQSLIDTLM